MQHLFFRLVVIGLLSMELFARQIPNEGSKVTPFSLLNQYDVKMEINASIKRIVYTPDKVSFTQVTEALNHLPKDFLDTTQTVFVADLSSVPSFVISLYIKPQIREYKYPVLLITDELDPVIFPARLEHISILTLDKGVITDIVYLKEIKRYFQNPKGAPNGKNHQK